MGRINPLIAIGIPSWGTVSLRWARAYRYLGGLLGSTTIELSVEGQPIAQARNQLMREAIASKADYLFMLGDDVLPPGQAVQALWQRMQDNPDLHLATGVYWTKGWPTQPYLWRDMQRGPYLDWIVGEWFPVDYAGCDCLLLRLSPEIKALGPEWFSTEWLWEPEQERPDPGLATEDFHFYTKARRAGLRLWCDSNVLCLHEDRQSRILFGLTADMPQAGGKLPALPEPGTDAAPLVRIADIGAGMDTPYWGPADRVKVVRFDGNEAVRPDYRCDIRQLPVPDQSFDVVHSRHALEHFGRAEAPRVLREWLRVLRVGGELRLCVPNVLEAMKRVIAMEEGAPWDTYPGWQLYGQQVDERDYHKIGFTPRILERFLHAIGGLTDIRIETPDAPPNIVATARKREHVGPMVLVPEWDAIAAHERISVSGLSAGVNGAQSQNDAPVGAMVAAEPPVEHVSAGVSDEH